MSISTHMHRHAVYVRDHRSIYGTITLFPSHNLAMERAKIEVMQPSVREVEVGTWAEGFFHTEYRMHITRRLTKVVENR